ncbi:MAG: hypothetical protein IPN87_17130 [Saprospiraceae bacterium]|nr:hypothetical protein [Candidatus Brachybacter algidus]
MADICLTDAPITLSATPPGGIGREPASGEIFLTLLWLVLVLQLIYEYSDANDVLMLKL